MSRMSGRMSRRLITPLIDASKRYSRHILGVVLFVGFIYRYFSIDSYRVLINSFQTGNSILALGFLYVLNYFYHLGLASTHQFLLAQLNKQLGILSLTKISIKTAFYNLLLPMRAGVAWRGLEYSKRLGLPLTQYIEFTLAFSLFGLVILGIIGSLAGYFSGVLPSSMLLSYGALTGMAIIGCLLVVWSWPSLTKILNRVTVQIKESFSSFFPAKNVISNNQNTLLKIEGTVIQDLMGNDLIGFMTVLLGLLSRYGLTFVVYSVKIWFLYDIILLPVSLGQAMIMALLLLSSAVIQIFPGGLGQKEMTFIIAAKFFGHTPEVAAMAALIDRLTSDSFLAIFTFLSTFLSTFFSTFFSTSLSAVKIPAKNSQLQAFGAKLKAITILPKVVAEWSLTKITKKELKKST